MKSMTGYAKRQIVVGSQKLSVEIKTLNSKQMEINTRIPSAYREKELDIRSLIGSLVRGKVDVIITLESTMSEMPSLNKSLAAMRMGEAQQLADEMGCQLDKAQIMNVILSQSEVWSAAVAGQLSDSESAQLMDGVGEALADVERFRAEEGEVLAADIAKHVDAIEALMNQVPQYEQERIETAKERIVRFFSDYANGEANKERFEQELIYYLEKLDITEEKVRLRKHIDYFRQTMAHEEVCGKKLGFVAQEMGREINTTGSKANHIEIQRLVVAMKDELEKIKEQLGNIL